MGIQGRFCQEFLRSPAGFHRQFSFFQPNTPKLIHAIKIQRKIKNNRAVRFLAVVILLYFLWELLYTQYLNLSEFSLLLCEILGLSSAFIFSLAGYEVIWLNHHISLDGINVIGIAPSCNGLEFFGLFACFVIAFPAYIRSKALFLPAGILLIHLLNMIRVLFLIVNYYYFHSSFEFNHHYTFNVVIYGVILVIWTIWAKKQMLKNETVVE